MQDTITVSFRFAWWARMATLVTFVVLVPFMGEKRATFAAVKVFSRGVLITAK